MRIVIDTNVLLVSFSTKSASHWLIDALKRQKFELAYTTEILNEYEEQFAKHWNEEIAEIVISSILELPNSIPTVVYYQLNLITSDEEDNKFSDCAFASNASYLVTNDTDFSILEKTGFPRIAVVSLNAFKQILIERNLIEP